MELTEPQLIHSFSKSSDEEVRLSVKEYKERYYIDLRVWFNDQKSQEFKPTKKGICLSLESLGELQKGISQLAKMELKNRKPPSKSV